MALGRLAAPARARTAHEYARETIRAAVLGGTLAGGARLVQSELAEELGLSTTPVREALRDLATEGLVIFDAHRGALVRSLDPDEVREIYELRMTLEPLMVRRIIEDLTDVQLARAAELQHRMDEPCDPSAWAELNREFHAIFSEDDSRSRLAGILAGLRDSAAAYVALSLNARSEQASEANTEHAALLDHFRRRDVDAAVQLTVQHLRATLAALEETHEAQPAYARPRRPHR